MITLRAWQVPCPVCEALRHKPCIKELKSGKKVSMGIQVAHFSRFQKALARERGIGEPARKREMTILIKKNKGKL